MTASRLNKGVDPGDAAAGVIRTKAGTEIAIAEVAQAALDRGVSQRFQDFVELTGDGTYRFKGKGGRAVAKIMDKRAAVENAQRMQMFAFFVRQGLDYDNAASEVGKFLFNYAEIPEFQRQVLRSFFPFVTFTAKNIEFHATYAIRNPGTTINQLKPFRGRSDENEQMVEFRRDSLKFRLDRDGKTLHALTGIDLPPRNLDQVFAGTSVKTLGRWGSMLSPLLKTPIEQLTGYNFFRGQQMVRTRSAGFGVFFDRHMPRPLKDYFGYRKEVDEAGRPTYTFDGKRFELWFRSFAFSRIVSTTDRQFRDYIGEDAGHARALLDFLTGIRVEDINLGDEQERLLRRRTRELEDVLTRRGALTGISRAVEPGRDRNIEF